MKCKEDMGVKMTGSVSCADEFESVVHMLWECPVHAAIRNTFMGELDSCGAVLQIIVHSIIKRINRLYYRVENWDRYDFKALLKLVKSFVLLIWDTWKNKIYGDQDGETSVCSCSCPLTGDHASSACVCGYM